MLALEKILTLNQGLVRTIVSKFKDRGVETEDLYQIGTIGMIKAVRSFDLDRGTAFSTYAVPLIFGEIRRHLRDEGPIKISRYYKKLGAMITNARNEISAREGRDAGIEELAALCSVSVEDAAMAVEAMNPIASLSDKAFGNEDDGAELGDVIADSDSEYEFERLRERIAISEAIKKMPQSWQRIILLRYYRDKTQQQTADILGLSQVKISREEKKIVDFLRNELA
jgi:RNA polymerase sporulation-specific sigma factor